MTDLPAFVRESNKIEGILREPLLTEVEAHERLLRTPIITPQHMVDFVAIVAPGKLLRAKRGMDVRVGNHIAPPGGRGVVESLEALLVRANVAGSDPHTIHCDYETLHPFMDGNGRSGRALWLWMHVRSGYRYRTLALGFLHAWYYESIEAYES